MSGRVGSLILVASAWMSSSVILATELAIPAQAEFRSWLPRDSARVRYFVTAQESDGWVLNEDRSDAIVPSPDGRHFFFTSQRGDLECDCNIYELSVYAVRDVIRALKGPSNIEVGLPPLRTVMMRHKEQAIEAAAWTGNQSSVIEFRGRMDPQSKRLPYRFDVISGKLEVLVQIPTSAELSEYVRHGDNVIYVVREDKRGPRGEYPSYALTPERIQELVFNGGDVPRFVAETYVSARGRSPWRMKSGHQISGGPWFSPDGRRALMVRHPEKLPVAWLRYDGRKTTNNPLTADDVTQFVWVDLERETEEPVFDAPTGRATQVGALYFPQAMWSEDGRNVVFANTSLPLDSAERAGMAYLVSYDVQKRRWEILEPYRQASGVTVLDVSWVKRGKEILVEHILGGQRTVGTIYTYNGSTWVPRTVEPSVRRLEDWNIPVKRSALVQGLTVKLRQEASSPPKVVASLGARELVLTAPDPALEGLWMARTEPLQWKDSEGVAHTSGLLLPRVIPTGGEKLPLVVQAGAYQPEQFRPDGPARTAYAAQAMVARNMVVLNLSVPSLLPDVVATAREMPMFIDWLESAVMAAAQKYPIDLDRVGLIGFSRMGYLTRYTVTNPQRLRPAAAIIADSYTGSFSLTLARNALGVSAAGEYDTVYGGPFFESKNLWLEREVSFNVDRVQTPILFADNSEDLTLVLDTIGAFKAARKPFEYLIFPKGFHQLLAPRQREASMEATVDWMAFWLLRQEHAKPENHDRYERWRAMRSLHEQNNHEAASKQLSAGSASRTVNPERRKVLDELKAAGVPDPIGDAQALNRRGYKTMYEDRDPGKAIQYFQWNLVLFPRHARDFQDSLAEGYLQSGEIERAIGAYKKALEVYPEHPHAARFITALQANPKSLRSLQEELSAAYFQTISAQKTLPR